MAWDFSNDPSFQEQLDWARDFLDRRIVPLEALADHWTGPAGRLRYVETIRPLQDLVKARGLWAAHLPPEYGGSGLGQVNLALLHEVIGRSPLAPPIFGNQAPDSGNAEILALFGSEDQRRRWLAPLLAGEIASCFAMTEQVAGADPTALRTRARVDGDHWVIDGAKWFISNASHAAFHIVLCRTAEPGGDEKRAFSMILVPSDTPGVLVVRDIATMADPALANAWLGTHAEVTYTNVRVPLDHVIGGVGAGFRIAQARLGPGRIHHAMRWLGQSQRAFDMLCERAVSRQIGKTRLADRQTIQGWVADGYAMIQASRLLTLQAAWRMDQLRAAGRSYADARADISLIKFWGAPAMLEIIDRAIQIHGALGYSGDLPLEGMYRRGRAARLVDGPDEVHRGVVAREVLRRYAPRPEPSERLQPRAEVARQLYADDLAAFAASAEEPA